MKRTAFVITISIMACMMLFSCEKEVYDVNPQMESFYIESQQLPSVTIDSVKSFSSKVDGFTRSYPLALEHEKYPKIKENIKAASLRLVITCDTTWNGETHINF